jgi:hypothetical protein
MLETRSDRRKINELKVLELHDREMLYLHSARELLFGSGYDTMMSKLTCL